MFNLYAPAIFELAKEIGRIAEAFAGGDHRDLVLTEEVRITNSKVMEGHRDSFLGLQMPICAKQVDRILEILKDEKITIGKFHGLLGDLYNRLVDECDSRAFLVLSDQEAKYYLPETPLFGKEIEDKLPTVIEDIAEAGKCLGLSRATASVFHLMRVMETGVQKFGDKLGVVLTDEKVWQVILDQLNAKIKTLGKGGQQYATISAHLYSVKLAWRNEVMHPKATYTVEEAVDIFAAVRRYMIDLIRVL